MRLSAKGQAHDGDEGHALEGPEVLDFFQWEATESEVLYEVKTGRPRSKSPRRGYRDTPNTPRADLSLRSPRRRRFYEQRY